MLSLPVTLTDPAPCPSLHQPNPVSFISGFLSTIRDHLRCHFNWRYNSAVRVCDCSHKTIIAKSLAPAMAKAMAPKPKHPQKLHRGPLKPPKPKLTRLSYTQRAISSGLVIAGKNSQPQGKGTFLQASSVWEPNLYG